MDSESAPSPLNLLLRDKSQRQSSMNSHSILLATCLVTGAILGPGLHRAKAAAGTDSLRVVIVDGQNNHNWRATTPLVKRILENCGRFTVDVSTTPPPAPRPPEAIKVGATPQQKIGKRNNERISGMTYRYHGRKPVNATTWGPWSSRPRRSVSSRSLMASSGLRR